MFKKIGSYALVLALSVTVLSACGSNKEEASNANASASNAPASNSAGAATNSNAAGAESAAPTEVTITHELGTATVKTNPEKVVAFDYGAIDTLDKLGVEIAALPKGSLPGYLSKYQDDKYTDVGTLFEPDFEKLAALKPDVIFIGGRTSEAYEELNKIAPTIQVSLDYANYAESFAKNTNWYAEIFSKQAETEALVAEIEAAKADLKTKAANAGKALVVLTTGGKISAYGSGSRFGVIHDGYGFVPADDKIESSTHGQSISSEYIAEKNPDILFVVDRDVIAGGDGAKPAKEVIENDLVKKTNAYKNGKIIYLSPDFWYLSGGGLQSELAMVKEAAQAVQ
ncbi:iron complex transport system substrate-binding protein [Paenibacillus catalpae]|uniref:Iron complex transport system substrate-binding protein n=1 Tax=Paenibacillus catalpae TaxID=1045775 RepID=A0A1I2DH82_9BACL|nr:siderophore ABC transporter substrate-binding protein [Paenibacillus catalpae]SFE79809.1 iron complex transport system substrate-binding protein [Paenibacillus catalpae]